MLALSCSAFKCAACDSAMRYSSCNRAALSCRACAISAAALEISSLAAIGSPMRVRPQWPHFCSGQHKGSATLPDSAGVNYIIADHSAAHGAKRSATSRHRRPGETHEPARARNAVSRAKPDKYPFVSYALYKNAKVRYQWKRHLGPVYSADHRPRASRSIRDLRECGLLALDAILLRRARAAPALRVHTRRRQDGERSCRTWRKLNASGMGR
jgi:hypothetical protein